jgi:ABC-type sugar transport system permease subunit
VARNGVRRSKKRLILPFLAPALILFGLFILYPAGQTLYLSFPSWQGVTADQPWAGLANFRELWRDPIARHALSVTFEYTALGGVILFPLAMYFAVATSDGRFGARTFRFIVLAPLALSVVTAAILWKFIFNPTFGPLNAILGAVGLHSLERPWLGDTSTALACVVVATIWHGLGQWVVLIGASLSRVPLEVREAALIDGARDRQVFFRITLPLVWETVRILLVLWIIAGLQSFAFVWSMTQGGPLNATEVLATYVYRTGFVDYRYGYAAAASVVTVAIIALFSLFLNLITRREVVRY